jgi:hypothetical protein
MSSRCTVCNHPARYAIDNFLRDGTPLSKLALQYGLSTSALSRHKKHLAGKLLKARQEQEQTQARCQLELLDGLEYKILGIINNAQSANNLSLAISGIRELLRAISLKTKIQNILGQ